LKGVVLAGGLDGWWTDAGTIASLFRASRLAADAPKREAAG
jgi:hypothetical protein